jgi:hypothetical protein
MNASPDVMLADVPIVEVVIDDDVLNRSSPKAPLSSSATRKTIMKTSPSEDQLFRPSIELSGLQSSMDNLNALSVDNSNDYGVTGGIPSFIQHLNNQVEKSKSRHKTSNIPAPVLFFLESYERSSEFVWNTLEQDAHT